MLRTSRRGENWLRKVASAGLLLLTLPPSSTSIAMPRDAVWKHFHYISNLKKGETQLVVGEYRIDKKGNLSHDHAWCRGIVKAKEAELKTAEQDDIGTDHLLKKEEKDRLRYAKGAFPVSVRRSGMARTALLRSSFIANTCSPPPALHLLRAKTVRGELGMLANHILACPHSTSADQKAAAKVIAMRKAAKGAKADGGKGGKDEAGEGGCECGGCTCGAGGKGVLKGLV